MSLNWVLVLQIVILMLIGALLIEAVWCAILEKKADTDIKRWREGVRREGSSQDR